METSWLFRLRFRRAHGSTYDSIFLYLLGHKRFQLDSPFSTATPSLVKPAFTTVILTFYTRFQPMFSQHTFNEWKQNVETKFNGGCMDHLIFR